MASPGLQKLIHLMRKWQQRSQVSIQAIRDGLDYMASTTPIPKDVQWEDVDAGGVPAIWVTTPGCNPEHVILHYHGGGWIAGSAKNSREFLGRISRATKARVISVDYRLAPEHPYPAAIEDAFIAYKWLLSRDISPKHLILLGESAGGNLVLVTLLKARNANLPLPVAAVLLSPATDMTLTDGSFVSRVKIDPFLSPAMTRLMVGSYVPHPHLLQDPNVSPIYADLKGLPSLFIQVGTAEILYDHSINFAAKAKKAGVQVEVDEIQDGLHAMAMFPTIIPEAAKATENIVNFIQKFFKLA